MTSKSQSLELIRRSGSTARVLNLNFARERHSDKAEYQTQPLFKARRLNESIIVKHTPRMAEKEAFGLVGTNVTKIIFPFAADALSLGGQSVFVEQANFAKALSDLVGKSINDPEFTRDLEVIEQIASMPSLDPYLLRERISRMHFKVSRYYFDISEADMERMRMHVSAEIQRLVALAFEDDHASVGSLSSKLANIFLNDEASDSLEPFRKTMRLSKADYREGMFGWKGFLYYKWQARSLQADLEPIAKEILSVRLMRANSEDRAFLNATRARIVDFLGHKAAIVRQAITRYDAAFNALVSEDNPTAFRDFLLAAPDMFLRTGDHLSILQHVASFWRFRFRANSGPPALEVEEAYDLFQEFESSLSSGSSKAAA